MLLSIGTTFAAIWDTTDHQLALFDLKIGSKTVIDIDVQPMNGNEVKQSDTTAYDMVCGSFSHGCDYLAVCDNRKQLIVFEKVSNTWRQTMRTKVSRNCIRVLFAVNNKAVICGHKSGDVFEHELTAGNDTPTAGRLLLGHCSMLLDLTQTNDSKYLITTDRDEKIRVTCYPNTYNIQSYCLGHKEFVSAVDCINNETIASGSGDGSIRLWNVTDGRQLDVVLCDPNETLDTNRANGTQFPVKKLVTNRKTNANLLCVSFYKQCLVKVFSIDSLSLKLIHTLTLAEEPIDIEFDKNESDILWVLSARVKQMINIYKISAENITESNIYENSIKQINCNETFQNNCINESKINVLDGLYKHWFNNVETYLQKKLERQEVMTKKKKFNRF